MRHGGYPGNRNVRYGSQGTHREAYSQRHCEVTDSWSPWDDDPRSALTVVTCGGNGNIICKGFHLLIYPRGSLHWLKLGKLHGKIKCPTMSCSLINMFSISVVLIISQRRNLNSNESSLDVASSVSDAEESLMWCHLNEISVTLVL